MFANLAQNTTSSSTPSLFNQNYSSGSTSLFGQSSLNVPTSTLFGQQQGQSNQLFAQNQNNLP